MKPIQPLIHFMPSKELGPLHLRPWTPSELDAARRLLRKQEQLRKRRPAAADREDERE